MWFLTNRRELGMFVNMYETCVVLSLVKSRAMNMVFSSTFGMFWLLARESISM